MTYLVFDTETSGKADFSLSATDPSQPKLVQLAGILFSEDHREFARISAIVQPDGWTFSQGAVDVHGITEEMAKEKGISLQTACELFGEFVDIADVVVAHNIKFDSIVMRQAFHMLGGNDPFAGKIMRCTMLSATNTVKVPKPSGRGYKWPSLAEALRYFRPDMTMTNAHDAMADASACSAIYVEELKMGLFN